MKYTAILITGLLFLFSCKPNTGKLAENKMKQENFDRKRENDSLRSVIEKAEKAPEGDTIQKAPQPTPAGPYPTFPGKHLLTLQWISWDRPGSVTIGTAADGWHSIQGRQNGPKGNYLTINGKIRPLNNRELEFDGKIETRVDYLSGGEPCVRTGKKLFKATGTRKYWRLQDMLSCDGTTTDYVDIYF